MERLRSLSFIKANKVKKVFKDACERFDLVYFGTVSQHNDEHQMVRGFTLSPSHVDRHYCVGTVSSRDVILLERTDTISFPDKPSKAYSWLILQIDLAHDVPTHVVLNSFKYDSAVYTTLFTKLAHLHKFDASSISYYDKKFLSRFAVYAPMQHADNVFRMIDPGVADVLGHHFHMMDFELIGDSLIVYCPTQTPSSQRVEHIVKAGIWLAGEIDKTTANQSSNWDSNSL